MLKLYNSLTKSKEPFVTLKEKTASMYVCGITPYDTTHLGHAFTYASFDVLVRLLRYKGYSINYTQNVTDINDRDNDILKRAKEQNIAWEDLAKFWTEKFLKDMELLNWIKPNNYIKASESIGWMINLVSKLIENKFAYLKNGSVYFDISKKKDYGKLSGLDKEQMLKIAKDFEEDVDNPDKKNPLDITLWKAKSANQPPHIPSFESPFGQGRPGWHIECSAMSIYTLGDQIDIHGGGIDLIYPHHEAEIAQSEGASSKSPFAKYWMHVAPVSYQGEKMSKSLGNLIMISTLLKDSSPNAIRWYLISHHYREPFEFIESDFKKNVKEYMQIINYANTVSTQKIKNENYFDKFIDALDDDLNTPLATEIVKDIYKNKGSVSALKECLSLLGLQTK
ncbi:MAG: cysteine--tRNA ligase [Candidatus Levybacteria bacterium]|nr:cysteine--tRNA ligase [Candidatus Levybacteria bacterium]